MRPMGYRVLRDKKQELPHGGELSTNQECHAPMTKKITMLKSCTFEFYLFPIVYSSQTIFLGNSLRGEIGFFFSFSIFLSSLLLPSLSSSFCFTLVALPFFPFLFLIIPFFLFLFWLSF
jgi:hypothetical protein